MSTERLYYADSHLLEFDARVITSYKVEGGRRELVLDRTAFYPTGGGQPFDTGAIGDARVVDCLEGDDGKVVHVVEGDAPGVGETVHGRVDWPRRLDHIQQHTGQHLLSQALVELHGAQTRSFRMTADACEIDVELRDPSDERVWRAVERANEVVWGNRPVSVHHVTAEEAARLPLRKDSAREGELRVVEIEGFDFSPCGGTHAQRTGEVGTIVARGWERAKGMTRIEFAAGVRAARDYARANQAARAASSLLTVGREEIGRSVERLLEENKQLARRNRALEDVAARVEADELLAESAARDAAGASIVARVFDARDAESLRRIASALVSRPAAPSVVALLGARDGDAARLVFARTASAPGDMGALMRDACATLEGRGGGRPDMAQGGGRRFDLLADVIDAAARSLEAT
ncbi:MAG TPA: DHHA1 domain-containing protein [Pyrinomonadaceae bacterium]